MIRMMSLCQSRSMILTIPFGSSCGASVIRCMITMSRFRRCCSNRMRQPSVRCNSDREAGGKAAWGRDGDDDEDTSSCDDGIGSGDGEFGDGEWGTDVAT